MEPWIEAQNIARRTQNVAFKLFEVHYNSLASHYYQPAQLIWDELPHSQQDAWRAVGTMPIRLTHKQGVRP